MKNKRSTAALFIAALSAVFVPCASAQENSHPKQTLERLFEAPQINPEWFAESFLSQVPASQVAEIIARMEQQYGSLQSITGEGQRFTVILERAEVPTRLVLDDKGRVAGLLFEAPVASGDISQQIDAIAALPGKTSVLVLSDGEVEAEHNPDAPLAAGSAAKLAILKAVADAVEAGRLSWDQVVQLKNEWRSLPTGILQDWPEGTPITVASLANLMISISDNTATDALIRIVGREAVESVTPRNAPFPTTRELFVLKADDALRAEWVKGDEAARREILDRIASTPLPDAAELMEKPTIEVEWFLSAKELCALMENVAGLPALSINPGVAERDHWREIAFKGGSEPGVLNFTTRVEGSDGVARCVTATWNNAEDPLNDQQLTSSYKAILNALRPEGR